MLAKIKYFLKHTFIYSIGTVVAKAAGFFLIPLYTNPTYLEASDFGLYAMIDIAISIASEALILGQHSAIQMFSNSSEYKNARAKTFFNSSFLVVILNFVFLSVIFILSGFISQFFSKPEEYSFLIKLSAAIIFFRVVNQVFLSKLRAEERSKDYTLVYGIKIVLSVLLIIYFLIELKLGIAGILYGYAIGEAAGFILILFPILKYLKPFAQIKIDKRIIFTAFNFGFPLIFASLASMFLNLSDRYILKIFTDFRTVAIYDLGYRIASVANMFLILPFMFTFMPNAFQMYGKPGDLRYYTKIMTYLTFVLVWAGLALSLFAEEFIIFFTNSKVYHQSYFIVPIIVLSYVFVGMRSVASLGLILKKKTIYIAVLTLLTAVLNIVLNFLLIPKFGIYAAAYNTLACFIAYYFAAQFISSRFVHIPFENFKVFEMIFAGVIIYLLIYFINFNNLLLEIIAKLVGLIIFPLFLYLANFFEEREIKTIVGFYKKWRNPKRLMENLSNLSSSKEISGTASKDENINNSNS